MSYRVISLSKVPGTDPQEFHLFLKDTENAHKGYMGRSVHGTEEAVREALALGGMAQHEIDLAFQRAKLEEEPTATRNIKMWFGLCSNGHIPLFEERKPNEIDACAYCGAMVGISGAAEGYVSHEERARGVATSRPLDKPNAAAAPARL